MLKCNLPMQNTLAQWGLNLSEEACQRLANATLIGIKHPTCKDDDQRILAVFTLVEAGNPTQVEYEVGKNSIEFVQMAMFYQENGKNSVITTNQDKLTALLEQISKSINESGHGATVADFIEGTISQIQKFVTEVDQQARKSIEQAKAKIEEEKKTAELRATKRLKGVGEFEELVDSIVKFTTSLSK